MHGPANDIAPDDDQYRVLEHCYRAVARGIVASHHIVITPIGPTLCSADVDDGIAVAAAGTVVDL